MNEKYEIKEKLAKEVVTFHRNDQVSDYSFGKVLAVAQDYYDLKREQMEIRMKIRAKKEELIEKIVQEKAYDLLTINFRNINRALYGTR